MTAITRRRLLGTGTALGLAGPPGPAPVQSWATKPIRVVRQEIEVNTDPVKAAGIKVN